MITYENPAKWEDLDSMTKEEIRAYLKAEGVRGDLNDSESCPLANATGWSVDGAHRWQGPNRRDEVMLTQAEADFIEEFDRGYYPELVAWGEEDQ